jgi:hypothetical protein
MNNGGLVKALIKEGDSIVWLYRTKNSHFIMANTPAACSTGAVCPKNLSTRRQFPVTSPSPWYLPTIHSGLLPYCIFSELKASWPKRQILSQRPEITTKALTCRFHLQLQLWQRGIDRGFTGINHHISTGRGTIQSRLKQRIQRMEKGRVTPKRPMVIHDQPASRTELLCAGRQKTVF